MFSKCLKTSQGDRYDEYAQRAIDIYRKAARSLEKKRRIREISEILPVCKVWKGVKDYRNMRAGCIGIAVCQKGIDVKIKSAATN